jgi:hypothetical protein
MAEDIVRVLRIIEYVGPRGWVEETVARAVQGTRIVSPGKVINAATLGTYPEILQQEQTPAPEAQDLPPLEPPVVGPEVASRPELPEIVTLQRVVIPPVTMPDTINPDGSRCVHCNNTYVHGWINGKPCPLMPKVDA